VAAPGSPVRIGPETIARAALLTCAHSLPIGRSHDLLEALTGIDISTGYLAGIRGHAARKLDKRVLPPCANCWPARRFCTPTRPRAAPPVPCPRCT
jgi:hypothetical protein